MNAKELIENALTQNPNHSLLDLLNLQPALLRQIQQAESWLHWQPGSRDGWYYTEDKTLMLNPSENDHCLIYWQERGGILWGETFKTQAEAIAWAYQKALL